jgi:hypothetical protein
MRDGIVVKTKDGHKYTAEFPLTINKELMDKLYKTAELLHEISKMWDLPDMIFGENLDEFKPSKADTGIEALHRSFLFNWYQDQAFVPVFFNRGFYTLLRGKMMELSILEKEKEAEKSL